MSSQFNMYSKKGRSFSFAVFIKFTSLALVFFILIQSINFVDAEEPSSSTEIKSVGTEESNNNDNSSQDNQILESNEGGIQSKDEADPELPEEPEMMSQSMVMGQDGLGYVSDGGLNNKAPQVNAQDGSFQNTYSITLPPGRSGFTPDLRLNYSSNNRANDNIFGYGWKLSIPSISRENKLGIETLYTSNNFTSSLDGELVQIGTSTYRARVDDGSSRIYSYINGGWVVKEKDGTKLSFGTTTQAQLSNPASSTQVHTWMLEEERDANGNYNSYDYYKQYGQIYPATITYTNFEGSDGIFEVTFNRESRPDVFVLYDKGFLATTTSRIDEILIEINGSWVRKYELGYEVGHNGNRSLLTSITESGRDESANVTTVPATEFEYESFDSDNKNWSEAESWTVPEPITSGRNGQDMGSRMIDVNGDGLVDWVRSWNSYINPQHVSQTEENIYLNTGSDWELTTEWTLPAPGGGRFGFVGPNPVTGSGGNDFGARFADVNGDSLTDILWAFDGYDSYDFGDVYLNNGVNGWDLNASWTLPSTIRFVKFNSSGMEDGGVRIADINGDQLPDLLKSTVFVMNSVTYETKEVYLNTGSGWESATSTWDIPEPFLDQWSDAGTELVDVNNDGLADILRNDQDTYDPDVASAYLNTGSGWVAADQWIPPEALVVDNNSTGVRFIDLNSDGLVDLDVGTAHLNTGEGWTDDTSNWDFPTDMYHQFTYNQSGAIFRSDAGVRLVDLDGDNMIDMVKSGSENNSPYYDHLEQVVIHNGNVVDLLSGVIYPEGGVVSADYVQSALYKTDSDELRSPELPYILDTVGEITYTPGEFEGDDEYSVNYRYGGGVNYYASTTDKKFAGFATSTTLYGGGNEKNTYFHQGNNTLSLLGEYADNFSKIGKPYLIETFNDQENLYKREILKWENYDLGNGADYVFNTRKTDQQYDGDSDYKAVAIENAFSSSTGNLLSTIEWGEVTASSTGSFTDTGSDKRTTSYEYAQNTPLYIVGLPSQVTVADQSSQKVKESIYYYDGQTEGSVIEGNLTKQEDWINSSNYINSRFAYNNYGLKTQSIDPRGATTTYSYDTYDLYPRRIANPLLQVSTSTFDYSIGKEKSIINPNGYAVETVFDGLDRVTAIKQPHPLTGASTIVGQNTYTYGSGDYSILTADYLSSGNTVQTYKYLDGFGKVIQERKEAETPGDFIVRDWIYGDSGLLDRESLPYFSEGSSKTEATEVANLYANHFYDALERPILSSNVVGTTTTSYDQWMQSVIDANGNQKGYGYDAYGRLVSVQENNGTSTYTTSYQWDLNDNLTNLIDALNNERSATYDGLNRRTGIEDLHANGDTTFGEWSYSYDPAGNVISTTDPNGQTVAHTYDALNRVLTENYTGDSGTEITYNYDSCANGKGYLCSVASDAATTTYKYAPSGKIQVTKQVIDGTAYVATTTYDFAGNLSTTTYPNNIVIYNKYDTAGNLNSVSKKDPGGIFNDIILDMDYGPHGQLTFRENANGSYTIYKYDENELYRLKSLKTVVVAGTGGAGADLLAAESELNQTNEESVSNELELTTELEMATTSKIVDAEVPSMQDINIPELSEPNSTTTAIVPSSAESDTQEIVKEEYLMVDALSASTSPQADVLEVDPLSRGVKNAQVANELLGKNYSEKVEIKSLALASVVLPTTTISNKDYDISIQIHRLEKIDQGIQVLVSAWRNGEPLGFGEDGSVEVERIRIINPPILVRRDGQLVEDLSAAILESVFHTVSLIAKDGKNIEAGKIGNTTTTAYPAAGANSPVDGRCAEDRYNNWSSTRNSTSCRIATVTNTSSEMYGSMGTGYGPSYYAITHQFIGFDVSSIADADIINSATLSVYGTSRTVAGSHEEIYAVSSSQASASNLSTSDFDNVGSVSYGESDNSFSVGSYNDIPLNSLGLSAVSKTGITQFAIRPYYDFANVTPDNSNEMQLEWYMADQSGTTNDPKLVVQHGSNVAPSAPILLQVEEQADSPMILDTIPEFSAIYKDSNVGDYATKYRIQVSASSSNWTSPYWDSGTTTLGTTAVPDTRSENITYGGSELDPSVTYYWRIRFVDSSNAGGAWSTTTSSFSLAQLGAVQYLIYDYDPVGNITSIVDNSDELNPVATRYGYDDLNRLISMGTSTATVVEPNDVVIQPGSTDGKDTYYGTGGSKTSGVPNGTIMEIGGWGNEFFAFIQFPLNDAPEPEEIEKVDLYLYNEVSGNAANNAKLHRITSSWTESGVNQYNVPSSVDLGMEWQPVADSSWWTVDVTDLVTDWLDGTYTNYGVMIDGEYTSNSQKHFRSSDYATSTYHPKLVIQLKDEYEELPTVTLGTTTSNIETYSYNAIGNLTSKSDQGSYSYLGNQGGNYANPHAATSINAVGLSYDNNGNLLSYGPDSYLWDYKNRLIESDDGVATVYYTYDHTGQRLTKDNGTTTFYPFPGYEVKGATSTIYVSSQNGTLTSIDQNGSTTVTNQIHTDHLGSTRLMTGEYGQVLQKLDYYPFGAEKANEQFGDYEASKRYIGQDYDEESEMSYLNARYYDGARGQFLSQDPVFWEIGQTDDGYSALINPQLQNSYSYAGNNPITNKDPDGRFLETGFDIAMFAISVGTFISDPSWTNAAGVVLDGASVALPGIPAVGGVAVRAAKYGEKAVEAVEAARTVEKASDASRAGKPFTPKGKAEVINANKAKNEGVTTCENCGTKTVPGQKSQKGVTPPKNETQVDHVVPQSKGGSGTPSNGQVLCRDCNIRKSNE